LGPRRRRFKSCRSDHLLGIENTEENENPGIPPASDRGEQPKDCPNISGEFLPETERPVTFPKRLRFNNRGKPLATIYKRPGGGYRLYWRQRGAVDGKPASHMKDFRTYTEAKRQGEQVVKDLAKGRAVALTPGQASEAVASFKALQNFYESTGKRLSLLESVTGYCGAVKRLGDRPLGEAVDSFLANGAQVKRVDLLQAAEEWLASRRPRTVAKDGQAPATLSGLPLQHLPCPEGVREFAKTPQEFTKTPDRVGQGLEGDRPRNPRPWPENTLTRYFMA
jgi:hypothetical protein